MTEIPEHLLKRAQAATATRRQRRRPRPSRAAADAAAAETPAAAAGEPAAEPRIPAHLLERSRAAKAKADGGADAAGRAPAAAPSPSPSARHRRSSRPRPTGGGVPVGAGPGGHTQRLLTVVKSGSIQEVKASPVDKVHTWPHLLAAEFVAVARRASPSRSSSRSSSTPRCSQLANTNQTPNPSKAPWYFLGLQELLTMFHPMVAGVTIPGVGLIVLIFAPYIDKNPSNKPEDRKFATSLMTIHLMFWAVLVIIGSFFRGPGFNFTLPWRTACSSSSEREGGTPDVSCSHHRHRRRRRRRARRHRASSRSPAAATCAAPARCRARPARDATAGRAPRLDRAEAVVDGTAAPPRREVEAAGRRRPLRQRRRAGRPRARRAPWSPPDPEAIGVSRRQFFNRATVALMSAGIGALRRRRVRRLPVADGHGRLRPARSPSASSTTSSTAIRAERRLLLRARGPRVDHRVPGRRAAQGRGRLPGERLSRAWRHGIVALYQKCPHLGCRVPELRHAASGSSARATARSTTGSARRRPARRRAAWTASRSRSTAAATSSIDTGTVVTGPPIGTNTTGQEAEGPHCITGGHWRSH